MGIPDRFQKLLSRIQPTHADHISIERHLNAIKSRLSKAFTVADYVVTGSYSRGSGIHKHSDTDLFVVIARTDLRWGNRQLTSNTILEQIRQELLGRYTDPSTTVRKDVHSITVTFSDAKVDVVPAYFSRFAMLGGKNWPVFAIPDGNGWWKETSPTRHNALIAEGDMRSRGKLKYTAQLMKHWRYSRASPIPVSSFHLELLMVENGICAGTKGYASCIRDLLRLLAVRYCRGLQDPLGISGVIACSRTESQQRSALATVLNSRDHANSAEGPEGYSIPEAVRQWKLVFNGDFPS